MSPLWNSEIPNQIFSFQNMKCKNVLTHLKIFTEINFFVLDLNQDIKALFNIYMCVFTMDLCSCLLVYISIHRKHLTICDTKMVVNKIPQLQANSRKNHVKLCIWIHSQKSLEKTWNHSVGMNLIRSSGPALPLWARKLDGASKTGWDLSKLNSLNTTYWNTKINRAKLKCRLYHPLVLKELYHFRSMFLTGFWRRPIKKIPVACSPFFNIWFSIRLEWKKMLLLKIGI